MRTYDEIVEVLEDAAEYELVVSTARQHNEEDDGENYLALVTVDGVTRGVVTRESTLEALDLAAERVLSYEEPEDDYYDEDEDAEGESLFDRAIGALENAVSLLRQVRR